MECEDKISSVSSSLRGSFTDQKIVDYREELIKRLEEKYM
jgi:hypothetical protein